jgi:hypothetical protein
MPWEQPLQQILQSIEGPVTKVIAVIVIITTGLSLAFGDAGGGFRRLIQIVFGLSIAFAASSFFLSFFSWRRSADLMPQIVNEKPITGLIAPAFPPLGGQLLAQDQQPAPAGPRNVSPSRR